MKTQKPLAKPLSLPVSAPKKAVAPPPPPVEVGGFRLIPEAARSGIKEAQAAVELATRELGTRAFHALQADTQMRQAAQALEQKQSALVDLSKQTLADMGLNTTDQNWNLDFTSFEAKRIA